MLHSLMQPILFMAIYDIRSLRNTNQRIKKLETNAKSDAMVEKTLYLCPAIRSSIISVTLFRKLLNVPDQNPTIRIAITKLRWKLVVLHVDTYE